MSNDIGTRYYNKLMYHSIRLVVNSITIEELEFYETKMFRTVLKIAIVVATIVITVTTGPQNGATFWEATTAALAALATVEGIKALVINLIINWVIGRVSAYVINKLQIDNQVLGAIVAAVAAYITTVGLNFGGVTNLTSAQQLLTAVDAANIGAQLSLQIEYNNLKEDYEEFVAPIQEELDELEEKLELLESAKVLGPEAFLKVGPSYYTTFSPTQFFQKSLLTNPGVLVLDQIPTFVDRALDLPGVTDTHINDI